MDLISIILTTYKGTKSIFQCTTAAMKQDYPNIEVIVVDDNGKGTTEQKKTETILNKFFSYENFKYVVHEVNKNGSAARNTGILKSNGAYITFLDDDDILHSNSVRLRYQKLKKMSEDYGIVFSSYQQYIGEKKDISCIYKFEGDIFKQYLQQKINSPSSVIMVRREVIENVGLWDESFYRHQDWEFVTRVLAKYKACSIPEISIDRIVTWRNNAKNPVVFERQRLHYLKKMEYYINMLNKNDIDEVYYRHYMDIGKNYLKNKKFKRAIIYAKKSGHIIRAFYDYATSIIRYSLKYNRS